MKDVTNNVLCMLMTNFLASHVDMDGWKGTVTNINKVAFKDTEAYKVAKGNHA